MVTNKKDSDLIQYEGENMNNSDKIILTKKLCKEIMDGMIEQGLSVCKKPRVGKSICNYIPHERTNHGYLAFLSIIIKGLKKLHKSILPQEHQ